MTKIYNLNNCDLSYKNASYGGMAGSKEGIIFEGQEWLVKYPQSLYALQGTTVSYSTSPLSEFIGSHIYSILGYDVHKTILAIRNGKLVVGCKDFATKNKMLLEMRTIKNFYNKDLCDISDGSRLSSSQTHTVDIGELMLHFEKNPVLKQVKGIEERFFEQAIIDIFIGNNDRNNGNWGILREPNKPDALAPIYDNGASFNSKLSDEKLLSVYNSPEFTNQSTNIVTAYGLKGHHFSAKKFFKFFESNPTFIRSMQNIIPKINNTFDDIKKMIYEIPEKVIQENGETIEVISEIRKKIYFEQLKKRYEVLLLPEFEYLKSQPRDSILTDMTGIEHTADKIEAFIEDDGFDDIEKENKREVSR